jgi:ketosteroid isomerase-like protein
VYHTILKRKLRHVFAELSKGNYEPVLASMAPRFQHVFAGAHALGGFRSTPEAYRKWFERLRRVFPDLKFQVRDIAVSGGPRNTIAAVEWTDEIRTANGELHRNSGVHMLRMRWGKVWELRIYTDTQKVEYLCRIQAAHGIAEAASPALEG